MTLDDLKAKWQEWIGSLNKAGIPVPTIRDPKTGQGSVSLTLVFLSFNLCVLSILGKATIIILKALRIGGLDGDTANLLAGIDAGQALSLFIACAGLYFGRKLQTKSGDVIESSQAEKPEPPSPPES